VNGVTGTLVLAARSGQSNIDTMLIIGIVLIVASVVGFFFMRNAQKRLHAMIGTETSTIPELEDQRRISDELGARGGFRKVAEVVGAAHPRPEGLLTAEISKTQCVWYRYQVERQYEDVEYNNGHRRTVKRTETVAEQTSFEGYALIDEAGRTIGVDPNGTNPDGVEQTVSRFEQPQNNPGQVEMFGIKLPNFFGNNGGTIGFEYKEWVIRPGRRLYILGEVHDKIGPLVIAKPQDGPFIISNRTEDELRASATQQHNLLRIGVLVAFALGVVLTVLGIVT
jgi:E3 ubiquitin ligase